ncbi:MAG: Maf-like protein, partial [Acidimicrobiia bacterium]|nr:Maf-like protein [Acidimicrobiia bacterium]
APSDYVERLARAKAEAVTTGADELVVAADTAVVLDGRIFGKPRDEAEAGVMLAALSGRSHEVMTGVAVARRGRLESEVCVSRVEFAAMSTEDIGWYIATGEPFDKAGAYALQGVGGMFVDAVHGNVQAVVGLPVATVRRLAGLVGVELLGASNILR